MGQNIQKKAFEVLQRTLQVGYCSTLVPSSLLCMMRYPFTNAQLQVSSIVGVVEGLLDSRCLINACSWESWWALSSGWP